MHVPAVALIGAGSAAGTPDGCSIEGAIISGIRTTREVLSKKN